MEKLELAKHEERMANPFSVQMEGPMMRCTTANKHEPKIDDTGDIGRFGSRGGGDWG